MAPKIAQSILNEPSSTDELSAELEEMIQKYVEVGIRFRNFGYQGFLDMGLAFQDVQRIFRFLDSFLQQGIFLALVSQAESHGVIPVKAAITPAEFLGLYEWLREDEGKDALRKVQVERKLTKTTVVQATARDIAYVRLLEQQKFDLTSGLKQRRAETDAIIADHMALIAKAKEEMEAFETTQKQKYSAAANLPTVKLWKLRDMCWLKYLDRCSADGKTAKPRVSTNLLAVTEEFRTEVSQEFVHEYCKDPKVRRSLIRYGDKKIKMLKSSSKQKEVQRFRGLIATASGKVLAETTPAEEETADENYTHGEADEGSQDVDLLPDVEGTPDGDDIAETSVRVQTETPPPKKARVGRKSPSTAVFKHTRRGSQKRKGSGKKRHPNREE